MGRTELAANFFRVTQTEEKLRKDSIRRKQKAFNTHYAVGRQVWDAMLKISGIAPEDLPAADGIRHAEKRLKLASPSLSNVSKSRDEKPAQATSERQDLKPIDLRKDLWKYALLVMVQRSSMEISTSDLIAELPKYIVIPTDAIGENESRKDSKFSQLVRDLKSHRTAKTNFIYQGYAEPTPGGFKATVKGREFVLEHFRDYLGSV